MNGFPPPCVPRLGSDGARLVSTLSDYYGALAEFLPTTAVVAALTQQQLRHGGHLLKPSELTGRRTLERKFARAEADTNLVSAAGSSGGA